MKSIIQRVLFAVAVATFGAGAVGTASAQTTSSAPGAVPQPGMHGHHHHFGGGRFVGTLLRATRQLNLTAEQQTNIRNILKTAHSNFKPGQPGTQADMKVMGNPSDPGFSTAVQTAAASAASRVQKESVLAGQIYAQLTPAQQQQLPTVLASIQAKEAARRAAWAAKHASGNG